MKGTITLILLLSAASETSGFWRLFSNKDAKKLQREVKGLREDLQQFMLEQNDALERLGTDLSDIKDALNLPQTAPSNVVQIAIQNGVDFLLSDRGDNFAWGPRQTAEAILALRLGDGEQFSLTNKDMLLSTSAMEIELLNVLIRNPTMNDTRWGHGKLGVYVTALRSMCVDSQNFHGFDLLKILRSQLSSSKSFFESQRFALSWMILGLCTSGAPVEDTYTSILAKDPGNYTFGVDEASMIAMALSCVNDSRYLTQQQAAENVIIRSAQTNDMFGNEYSTGLAIQALTRSAVNLDAVIQPSQDALARSIIGKFTNVAVSNQVLPALALTSYADVLGMCPAEESTTLSPPTTTKLSTKEIHLQITVRDSIVNGTVVNETWYVTINEQQTVYEALRKLRKTDTTFTFVSEKTSWGQSMKSILNIRPDSDLRQYWSFRKFPGEIMKTGVSNTRPTEDTHYIFQTATW